MKERPKLTLGDMILMGSLLLTALFLFCLPFFAKESGSAKIVLAETGQVRTVSLDTEGSYEVTSRGVRLTVRVQDGNISVVHADCRDGICQNTPPISRAGQSIVCAPAGVVIRITGEEAVVDGVSG